MNLDLSNVTDSLPDLAAGDERVLTLVFVDRPVGGPDPRQLPEAVVPTAAYLDAMAPLLGCDDRHKVGVSKSVTVTTEATQVVSEPFGGATLADLDGV